MARRLAVNGTASWSLEKALEKLCCGLTVRGFSSNEALKDAVLWSLWYQVIKKPMDLSLIRQRIMSGALTSLDDMSRDLFIMCNNAMVFNGVGDPYFEYSKVSVAANHLSWLLRVASDVKACHRSSNRRCAHELSPAEPSTS